MRRDGVSSAQEIDAPADVSAAGGAEGREKVGLGVELVEVDRGTQQLLGRAERAGLVGRCPHEGQPAEPIEGIRVLGMDAQGRAEGLVCAAVVAALQKQGAEGELGLGRARAHGGRRRRDCG